LRPSGYDARRLGARFLAHGNIGRRRLAASLAVVSTVLSWLLLAVPAEAAGVPTNISPPTISGTPQVGQILTEAHGSWTNQPTRYTYHWARCASTGSACVAVTGATAQTYTLTTDDVGHAIVVAEIAHNASGASTPARSAPSAVVTAAPPPPSPPTPPSAPKTSVTALVASPAAPVVNQAVTLTAAVTSTDSTSTPSGSITFLNGTSAIDGCANEPVVPSAQTVIVSCQTSFAASTAQLTAVFSPSAGATVTGSSSPTIGLVIDRDTTSISLDVSKAVGVGSSTAYSATVTSAPGRLGTLQPTGTVEFLDGGQPIASCSHQPLTKAGAACTVAYNAAGSHTITAQYGGDANFRGSSAPAQPVSVITPPPQVLGLIGSTMQWTFHLTTTYTQVLALVVNGASGATVTMNCHGRGCRSARYTTLVSKTVRCGQAQTGTCPARGSIDLAPRLLGRRLSLGAQITVAITRPGWIGKYYRFTVRTRRAPRVQIACLAPGAIRPGAGCSGRG
jgi:Bacterial Ig-like domain (group 3)